MDNSPKPATLSSPATSPESGEEALKGPVSPLDLPPTQASEPSVAPPSVFFTPMQAVVEHVAGRHGQDYRDRQRAASVVFKNPAVLPSPRKKPTPKRSALSPPPPPKYRSHVSFDSLADRAWFPNETTVNNVFSLSLNYKHLGYQGKKSARTFMVGIDENDYSETALRWLLEELVDDGDEIVCVRVLEDQSSIILDHRGGKKHYKEAAQDLMERIQALNESNRAISIVLEVAMGKLHPTFTRMFKIYNPGMLIVGTRGRSLGGVKSLFANRNSFSKWCLQFSPIPVVVVRPLEKREKKRKKREMDPDRHDYAKLLRDSGLENHEIANTAEKDSQQTFEISNNPEVEAAAVAAEMGNPPGLTRLKREVRTAIGSSEGDASAGDLPSPESEAASPVTAADRPAGEDSSEEDEEEEDGAEFDVVDGRSLLGKQRAENPSQGEIEVEKEKKKKLHEMEMKEAETLSIAARKKKKMGVVAEEVDYEDDEGAEEVARQGSHEGGGEKSDENAKL